LQLFTEVLIEDPALVQEIALSLLEVGPDEEKETDSEKQVFILDSFSTLLELAMLCHRLMEVVTRSVGWEGWFSCGDLRDLWSVGKK